MSPVAQARPAVARIVDVLAALTVGAAHHFPAVLVRRESLLTFNVNGFFLDLEEAAAEAAYLADEREAIQSEPSLPRAAEIVARQQLSRRGIDGTFSVSYRGPSVQGLPVWRAIWIGRGNASRYDRAALDELAAWARGMGLRAERIGYEVIASLPPDHPGLVGGRGASSAERAA